MKLKLYQFMITFDAQWSNKKCIKGLQEIKKKNIVLLLLLFYLQFYCIYCLCYLNALWDI